MHDGRVTGGARSMSLDASLHPGQDASPPPRQQMNPVAWDPTPRRRWLRSPVTLGSFLFFFFCSPRLVPPSPFSLPEPHGSSTRRLRGQARIPLGGPFLSSPPCTVPPTAGMGLTIVVPLVALAPTP